MVIVNYEPHHEEHETYLSGCMRLRRPYHEEHETYLSGCMRLRRRTWDVPVGAGELEDLTMKNMRRTSVGAWDLEDLTTKNMRRTSVGAWDLEEAVCWWWELLAAAERNIFIVKDCSLNISEMIETGCKWRAIMNFYQQWNNVFAISLY